MRTAVAVALIGLILMAGTAEAERASPLLDGVEASLEAVRKYEERQAEPNAKKLKLVTKLLAKLDTSTTGISQEVGLLKKVAAKAEKKLADEAQVQIAVEVTVNRAVEQARDVLATARSHLEVAPEGKSSGKALTKVDKAGLKLDKALQKPSIKKVASALFGATKAAEKSESKARSVAEAGVSGADGFGGYYSGSGSDGEWVSAYVSGAGELTVIAPGLATFKIKFDTSGKFAFTKNECKVTGRITDRKITAVAKCEDGGISYTLTKEDDGSSGAAFAGTYEQDLGSGGIQAMVTPGGSVFFNYEDEFDSDSGRGSIRSDGSFSLRSDYDGTITGKAQPNGGGLSGTYQVPDFGSVNFQLQRSSAGAPKPLSIKASQGTFANHIEIEVEMPDTRKPHSLVGLRTYHSFTDQFADASPAFSDTIMVIGGIAPGKKTRRFPGTTEWILNRYVRNAPRIYFWATIISEDGESEPVGPVAGWTSQRKMIPTAYLAAPGAEGERIRSQYKSGTLVGDSWMRPYSNMPGKLELNPAHGTPLADGVHIIEVLFTPSVPGYNAVTQQFEVTIGGGN